MTPEQIKEALVGRTIVEANVYIDPFGTETIFQSLTLDNGTVFSVEATVNYDIIPEVTHEGS